MKRLTLNETAQIAEVVAAVAVVVSLIYVGVGLRDNTAAVRSASIQAITTTSQNGLIAESTSADLSRIRRIGDEDYEQLDLDERRRYFTLYRQIWLSFQNVFFQRDLGTVGADLWGTYQRIICNQLSRPGVKATWPNHAAVLDPGFVAAAEGCSTF
ncbi:MAG: hypothetical protein PVH89_09205 [Gammaproteobacteria bacterium]